MTSAPCSGIVVSALNAFPVNFSPNFLSSTLGGFSTFSNTSFLVNLVSLLHFFSNSSINFSLTISDVTSALGSSIILAFLTNSSVSNSSFTPCSRKTSRLASSSSGVVGSLGSAL